MKLLLSFIFSIFFLFLLNAQEEKKQLFYLGSILVDEYTQAESYALNGPGRNLWNSPGTPVDYFSDGQKMRFQVSIGLRKINDKGNYHTVNVFAGGEKWERRTLVDVEDEDLGDLKIPIVVGQAGQNIFGLNATKSFRVIKNESQLRAYLGVRVEGRYTMGTSGSGIDNIPVIRRKRFDVQAAFVPEMIYSFPGDRFAISMAMHLLPIGVEFNENTSFDRRTDNQLDVNSFQNFDFMNHNKSRFEIGFGWLL